MARFSVVPRSAPAVATPRRSYWLPVSIAINLLLIGVVVAWIMAEPVRRAPLVTWQREILPSLTPADAAIVTAAADRIAAMQGEADQSVHSEYAQVRALLATEPPDRRLLEEHLKAIGVIRNNAQTVALKTFLDELVAVSPDGRATMLHAMERESRRAHRQGASHP
jgi:hypothetical protein